LSLDADRPSFDLGARDGALADTSSPNVLAVVFVVSEYSKGAAPA